MTAKAMSHSHSQANQGVPGIVYENRSWCGTRWLARIHWPVRRCQPVSASPSMLCVPPMHVNRNTSVRMTARSVRDGRTRTIAWTRSPVSARDSASAELSIATLICDSSPPAAAMDAPPSSAAAAAAASLFRPGLQFRFEILYLTDAAAVISEFHVIHAQGHTRGLILRGRNPHYRSL